MRRENIEQMDKRPRFITDADAEAIASALKSRIKKDFYEDLGRGVWAIVWRSIIILIVAIAALGAVEK